MISRRITNDGIKWTNSSQIMLQQDAGPKYSRVTESIRHVTPGHVLCSMFCGGKQCKYDNPAKWKDEEMVVKGLYSSWITDDILAMARPSTEAINKYNIIQQFKDQGIKSVMNLQHPGEHAYCGFGLEDSGFSYIPEDFMNHEVFFYNFGWQDYGVRSLEAILDMVKVMCFALEEGKAAVHCHAGLGRTGVLIACYLIYSRRITGEEAIHLIRSKRPKSVQTRGQIDCVKTFYKFLKPFWVMFPQCSEAGTKNLTLTQYMVHQRHLLHGFEARRLKNIPKVLHQACLRLLQMAGCSEQQVLNLWNITRLHSSASNTSLISSTSTSESDQLTIPHVNTMKSDEVLTDEIVSEHTERKVSDALIPPEGLRRAQSMGEMSQEEEKLQNQSLEVDDVFETSSFDDQAYHNTKLRKQWSKSDFGIDTLHLRGGLHLAPLDVKVNEKKKKRKKKKKEAKSDKSSNSENSQTQKNTGDLAEHKDVTTERMATVKTREETYKEEKVTVGKALSKNACVDTNILNKVDRYKRLLNSSDAVWDRIMEENDPLALTCLMWAWLEQLQEPVLSEEVVQKLNNEIDDPLRVIKTLDKDAKGTVECLISTLVQLMPLSESLVERILRRFAMVLTQNKVLPLCNLTSRYEQSSRPGTAFSTSSEQSTLSSGSDLDSFNSPSFLLFLFLKALLSQLMETLA